MTPDEDKSKAERGNPKPDPPQQQRQSPEQGAELKIQSAQKPAADSAAQPGVHIKQANGFQRLVKMSADIPKTLLDLDACRSVVGRLLVNKEAKVKEQQDQAAKEPIKPFIAITKYKKSSLCPLKWDDFSGTSRIRYCEKCQLQVYDFAKVELPQAEELVKNREDKDKFDFYKRVDGKFMTANCPVGRTRERNIMLMAAGSIFALVLVNFLVLQAPPNQQAKQVSTAATVPAQQESKKQPPTNRKTEHKPKQILEPTKKNEPDKQLAAIKYFKEDSPNAPKNGPAGPPATLPDFPVGAVNPLYHKDDTPNPPTNGPRGTPVAQQDIKLEMNPRYQAALALQRQNGPGRLPAGFPLNPSYSATAGSGAAHSEPKP